VISEGGIIPGVGVVAEEAVGGESTSGMFSLVVLLVAGVAVVGVLGLREEQREVITVAALACQLGMRSEERESAGGCGMVEGGIIPGVGVVARGTCFGESQGNMVDGCSCRTFIVLLVAGVAISREGTEESLLTVPVACRAIRLKMGSREREACLCMNQEAIDLMEILLIVTALAIGTEGSLMDILMAGYAGAFGSELRLVEAQVFMAALAGEAGMGRQKGEIRHGGMVEGKGSAQGFPCVGSVAGSTVNT